MSQVVSSNLLITNNSLLLFNSNKFKYKLFLLQRRIYKAAASYDYKRMHKLQKLLLSSNYSKLVAALMIIQDYLKVSNLVLNKIYARKIQDYHNINNQHIYTNIDLSIKQIYNLITHQTIIKNLNHKINQSLVYFCLKPEWEAKFNTSNFYYIIKASRIKKLSLVSNICKKYSTSTKKQHVYILQGIINMLNSVQNLNYLLSKLQTITQIHKLIKSHIYLCSNRIDNKSYFLTSQLLDLLTNIFMEDLSLHICLKQQYFMDSIHRTKNTNLVEKFIWDNNSFVFISDSKNRVVFIKSQIESFCNTIGSFKSIQNLQILKLQQGFDFLGFHIQSVNYDKPIHCQSKIIIQPSFESKLRLLKTIKKILYHKDKFYRNRANTHLSTKFVIPKIYSVLQQWKKYYCIYHLVNIITLKKLNLIIQEIIYRWAIKKYKKKSLLKHKNNIGKISLVNPFY